MKESKLCGIGNYRRKPKYKTGSIHKAHPSHLKQCFITKTPNEFEKKYNEDLSKH